MDYARKQYELTMDNARKQYELDEPVKPDLKQYYKEYHLWKNDFKKRMSIIRWWLITNRIGLNYTKNLTGSLNTKFGCRGMVTG